MTTQTEPLRIVRVPLEHPDARQLVEEVQAEYVEIYGSPDEAPIDVSEFAEGAGAFCVGYLDVPGEGQRRPVGTAAWRWVPTPASLGAEEAGRSVEVKRMYVRRAFRRTGLARQLLAHVEEDARAAGATFIVLETGPKQAGAVALYRSAGYAPVPDFGHYLHLGAHAFGKRVR